MSEAMAHVGVPLKGIDIEDKNIKVVYLKSGKYLVDGEVITVEPYSESKVQVKDASNIRKITENKYIKEYVCGEEKISVSEYNEQRERLLSKQIFDEDGSEWEKLEDEFACRKFMQSWTAIYNIEQEISEPLLVQIEKTKYDTVVNIFIMHSLMETIRTSLYSHMNKTRHGLEQCESVLKN